MKLQIYETNYGKNRFMEKLPTVEFYDDKPDPDGREDRLLNIYPEARYQEIVGFGGAMTEATALNLEYMGEELHKKAMELYFDSEKGIGYSLIRSTINSCDFSKDFYSYDEVDGDHELKNFDISHDREYIIPALKEAFETAEELKLYCSPWSPPAWMKTNGRMNRGGKLKNDCYQTWAHYFTRFIQEYEKEGVRVWGVTPQNEAKAEQNWESCFYSKEEEAEFTNKYLKPDLIKNGLGDVKIFVWDHNKERTMDRALTIFKDKRITGEKGYEGPDGIAVHWYSGEHFAALDAFHNVFPDKLILGSEHSKSAGKTPEESGERYAHDIIGDLNNYSNGWTDWNMILDEEGNPDHWKDEQIESGWAPEKIWVGEAPIVYDKNKKELDIRSSYYYMGHISKFVRPGAVRIGSSIYDGRIETVSFENKDGSIVTVILNRTDEDRTLSIRLDGKLADIKSEKHSIITTVISKC